jgi:hypothetical protein
MIMNDELVKMWKEAVVTYSQFTWMNWEKKRKTSVDRYSIPQSPEYATGLPTGKVTFDVFSVVSSVLNIFTDI